jgi:hypothetical protein
MNSEKACPYLLVASMIIYGRKKRPDFIEDRPLNIYELIPA